MKIFILVLSGLLCAVSAEPAGGVKGVNALKKETVATLQEKIAADAVHARVDDLEEMNFEENEEMDIAAARRALATPSRAQAFQVNKQNKLARLRELNQGLMLRSVTNDMEEKHGQENEELHVVDHTLG